MYIKVGLKNKMVDFSSPKNEPITQMLKRLSCCTIYKIALLLLNGVGGSGDGAG